MFSDKQLVLTCFKDTATAANVGIEMRNCELSDDWKNVIVLCIKFLSIHDIRIHVNNWLESLLGTDNLAQQL